MDQKTDTTFRKPTPLLPGYSAMHEIEDMIANEIGARQSIEEYIDWKLDIPALSIDWITARIDQRIRERIDASIDRMVDELLGESRPWGILIDAKVRSALAAMEDPSEIGDDEAQMIQVPEEVADDEAPMIQVPEEVTDDN